jgi:hypothetical protein
VWIFFVTEGKTFFTARTALGGTVIKPPALATAERLCVVIIEARHALERLQGKVNALSPKQPAVEEERESVFRAVVIDPKAAN